MIREVEMGPFKHTVDDGLDLRKAAFECMYTLLDTCLDKLDLFEFLNHVEDGLKVSAKVSCMTWAAHGVHVKSSVTITFALHASFILSHNNSTFIICVYG